MIEEAVQFSSEGLLLEAVLTYKEGLTIGHKVLICSPHPNLGGDMDNNVITALAGMLAGEGYVTLRFNYRGVGGSQGRYNDFAENYKYWEKTFGDGHLEGPQNDTEAAFAYLGTAVEGASSRSFVVGYSFGAVMGLKVAAKEDSVQALVGIATPFSAYNFDFLKASGKPKLFICSDNDFATSIEDTKTAVAALSEPKELIIKTDTSHFYIGNEKELCRDVSRFLRQYV